MAETLPPKMPDTKWTQRADLAQLVDVLGADDVRWVGGCVRDALLGIEASDIDAATRHHPEAVMEKLDAVGIRHVPTGIDHGTITAVLEGGPVEITTLRRDVSTDGRRATVEFAQDWRDDAARRDFTLNALFAHPKTQEISDYFGGLADLARRHVRFIGSANERIREDHLRILRYFRFQARFGSQADEEAENACRELAETLKGLSRERVAKELLLLLALPDPYPTIRRMRELGVLQVILPEAGSHELDVLEKLVAAENEALVAPDPMRRLAALLPALPPVAEAVASRLRLSRAQRQRLSIAAARKLADRDAPRSLAYRRGREAAIDRLLISGSSIAPLDGWHPPELPLKGGEIASRGIAVGPEIARILQAVERVWIEEGFPDRSRVEELLEAELAQRNSPSA